MNRFWVAVSWINFLVITGWACTGTIEPSPDVVSDDGSNPDDSTNPDQTPLIEESATDQAAVFEDNLPMDDWISVDENPQIEFGIEPNQDPEPNAPDQSLPDESSPDESLPDESSPDESAPDESKPCNDQCVPAGKSECREKNIFSCQVSEQGCNVWVQSKTCGSRQTCVDSSGMASCQCNHECGIENSPACQNNTTMTCRKDVDGCTYWEQTKQCGGKCCPLVTVQIHTYYSTPWAQHGPKNWGYWYTRSDMNPDNLYTNCTWDRRFISSLSYPFPYDQNQPSQNLYEFFKEGSSANVANIQYSGSYPYLCPYDSTNEDVIRYHIRAAKAAGIDAFSVSVFDVYADNRIIGGQPVCPAAQTAFQVGGMDRFNLYLAVAEQESFKIFLEIWVPGNANAAPEECGSIAGWVFTMARVINEAANSPAYLRINNQPVISPYWFGLPEDNWIFQQSINQVYWAISQQDIFWLVRGWTDGIIAYTQPDPAGVNFIDAIAVGGLLQGATLIASPDYNLQINQIVELKQNHTDRKTAAHIYPAFDDTFNEGVLAYQNYNSMAMKRVDTQGKNVFQTQIQNSIANGADILFIESWNDFHEQTCLEPSRVINGVEQSDPFVDVKTLANSQGMTFVAPPLPPSNSLDPLCVF